MMVGTSLLLLWTWSVGFLEGWVQRGCGEEISGDFCFIVSKWFRRINER